MKLYQPAPFTLSPGTVQSRGMGTGSRVPSDSCPFICYLLLRSLIPELQKKSLISHQAALSNGFQDISDDLSRLLFEEWTVEMRGKGGAFCVLKSRQLNTVRSERLFASRNNQTEISRNWNKLKEKGKPQ